MESGRDPYAAGIVALALAFHRAPVAHPELLHGRAPLPAGVGALLKLAGGSEPDPATAALAPADELRAAALFFIEQVLLHHDASHYRVLGLEPGAPIEQIKEHHRLLMRVFHPDRERHADDWKDAFAIRINLAYTSLHDPQARRRYDATLQAAPRPAPLPARRAAVLAKGARPRGAPLWLLRYLPQWVLAGTALLALAIVGAVYVSNPPLPAAVASKLPAETPLAAETPRPAMTARGEAAARAAASKPVIAAAEMPQTSAPVPAQSPARPAPPVLPEAPVPADPPARPTGKTAIGPQAAPTPIQQAEVPAPPAARPAAPEPVAAAAPQPAKLDPNATLERFMSAYERGDTPAFMALFDELAIGSAGGKTQIRRDHEALFRSTDLRTIAIDGMSWTQEGEWMRGEGRYRTTLMRKGTLRLETQAGLIHIALLRRGDQALIVALEYQPGESA